MQKNIFGLLGIGIAAVLVGVGLYWSATKPQDEAPQPQPAASAGAISQTGQAPAQPEKPAEAPKPADNQPSAQKPEEQQRTPVFDVLRVEPDGSVVIAGQAAPNADIEVVAGSKVLGKTKAGANGDFAVVLDEALKPGDHQFVLRATGADSHVATSAQTAIVSVPETAAGQVLALVEEPGQASRLITKPETQPATANDSAETTAKPSGAVQPASDAPLAIEAVEIEGQSVFVAGNAKGGSRVIVHANDILLGSSAVSPEGRFLVQSRQPLAVGDYIVKAELLDNANRVVATARVPFRREAGENISAVAPNSDGQTGDGTGEAAPLQRAQGSVIIRRGDNLWTISKRAYGKGTRYTTIYLANREQIRNPDLIWPGQVFNMPDQPMADDEVHRQMEKPGQ